MAIIIRIPNIDDFDRFYDWINKGLMNILILSICGLIVLFALGGLIVPIVVIIESVTK